MNHSFYLNCDYNPFMCVSFSFLKKKKKARHISMFSLIVSNSCITKTFAIGIFSKKKKEKQNLGEIPEGKSRVFP